MTTPSLTDTGQLQKIDWQKIENPLALLGIAPGEPIILRHYGPGRHPGTGTTQEVHSGGGLGELQFGDPHYRNNIKFNIPMSEALRMGLNQGEVNVLGVEFHQQLMRAMQDMESALGFPIQGLTITNDLMDFAVAVYGNRVLDNPTYREDTFGRLRAEALGWRGAYYKGVVWLDESLNTIMGPIPMENQTWQESVWHEIAHYLTGWDGRTGFSADYTSSMWHENSPLSGPSDEYSIWVEEHYGTDIENIHDEYRADLVAAWVGSQLDGRPPKWRRRFTGLQGPLPAQDLVNMQNIVDSLIEEGRAKAGLVERAGPDRRGILVLFKTTGELKVVSKEAIKTLPATAEVIGSVFDR